MLTRTHRAPAAKAKLERVAFTTSRLAEFVGEKELVAQIGHPPDEWLLVVAKELIDNAIDDAEEAEIAPEIEVAVSTGRGEIVIADNGTGLPAETLAGVLDYTVRVSSREAYVSPSRGRQGNALKCVLGMSFALDGTQGTTRSSKRAARRTASSSRWMRYGASLVSGTKSGRPMYKTALVSRSIGRTQHAICSTRQNTVLYKRSAPSRHSTRT